MVLAERVLDCRDLDHVLDLRILGMDQGTIQIGTCGVQRMEEST